MLGLFADIFMLKTHPLASDLLCFVFPSSTNQHKKKTKHIPSLSRHFQRYNGHWNAKTLHSRWLIDFSLDYPYLQHMHIFRFLHKGYPDMEQNSQLNRLYSHFVLLWCYWCWHGICTAGNCKRINGAILTGTTANVSMTFQAQCEVKKSVGAHRDCMMSSKQRSDLA
jgi:hypothetical protein